MPLYLRQKGQATESESEDRFLARVRRLATQHGWLEYHTRDSRRSPEGYPDLCLTNGTRIIFAELKSMTGKLTAKQAPG